LTGKNGPKMGRFGRKTGGLAQENVTFFCAFSLLRVYFFRKPLSRRNFQRARPSAKNRAKKPTVGFLPFGNCGMMWAMDNGRVTMDAVKFGKDTFALRRGERGGKS
jgi:hypothetical protein